MVWWYFGQKCLFIFEHGYDSFLSLYTSVSFVSPFNASECMQIEVNIWIVSTLMGTSVKSSKYSPFRYKISIECTRVDVNSIIPTLILVTILCHIILFFVRIFIMFPPLSHTRGKKYCVDSGCRVILLHTVVQLDKTSLYPICFWWENNASLRIMKIWGLNFLHK